MLPIRCSTKIGYVIKTFPKVSETFILQEILDLERHGIELTVFSLQRPTDQEMHPAVSRLQANVEYFPEELANSANGLTLKLFKATWLGEKIMQYGIQHLHAHFANEPTSIVKLLHISAGIPFSFTAHAKDIYLSPPEELHRKIQAARFVITCTKYNQQFLNKISMSETPIHHMYHGLEVERFQDLYLHTQVDKSTSTPIILSVGRFREKKGFLTLIRACHLLKRQGYRFRCNLIGYGPLHNEIEQLIQELGMTDCIVLHGKKTQDEVVHHYRQSTLFVLPCQIAEDGDRDGIPNVLFEALALGLPVVTTPISGIPELVQEEKNGILVPPKDPARLASAMARLLKAPDLCHRLGENGRERVFREFSSAHTARKIQELFQQLSSTNTPDTVPLISEGSQIPIHAHH